MNAGELAERRSEVQIIDVRWPNEWEAGRIEGALHIPEDELDGRIDDIDRSRPVITVCLSGARSASAAEQLRAEGLRAESLEGGMQAWAEEGLAVTTADAKPGRVVEPEPLSDDRPVEHQRIQSEMLGLLFDLQEHFGEREPSDDEVRAFLRQRLINEGRSAEEAEEFLATMDAAQE